MTHIFIRSNAEHISENFILLFFIVFYIFCKLYILLYLYVLYLYEYVLYFYSQRSEAQIKQISVNQHQPQNFVG